VPDTPLETDPPRQRADGGRPVDGRDDDWTEDVLDDDEYVYLPKETSWLRKGLWIVGGLFVFGLFVFALGGYWVLKQVDPGDPGEPVTVTIPAGYTTAQVANLLEQEGVVTNATVFQYYIRWRDAGPFDAGLYDNLHKRSSMDSVIDRLEAGPLPPAVTTITIPEGLWLQDIRAEILATFPQMNPEELDAALGSVRSKYQPEDSFNLEGLLLPATYQVQEGDEADEQKLVLQMVAAFDQYADEINLGLAPFALEGQAGDRTISPYEAVIVASMIEEEARVPEDRAKIARVIYNRLAEDMTLGIDATVIYALGAHTDQLTDDDLEIDSPYNTRRFRGLPPTPIASPGKESLLAAMNPEPGDWLYYVIADEEGRHTFTTNSRDHDRAVAEAREKGLL
jgi:UPF0755 protein